ncbi:family 16 glycoside hydrolase [Botrimarina sp.]|uniref:family 16 glycoside hydrolase n=1 Tax=Botrimarina sp. TaxID=2795802 RepID=UPI0032F06E21
MRPQAAIRIVLGVALAGCPWGASMAGKPGPAPPTRPADAVQLLGPGVCDFVALDGGPGDWELENGVLTVTLRDRIEGANHLVSKYLFQDALVHAEFWLPDGWTGNSGLYFHGLYELQILNSYRVDPLTWREMGSVYRFHKPLVNPAKPPKQWQTYHVRYFAPRRNGQGEITVPGRFDAWLNGIAVQRGAEFREPRSKYCTMLTPPTPYIARLREVMDATGKGPLILQEHLSPVRFRNIWVQPLDSSEPPPEPADPPTVTIGLIGDSTVADTYGWGPALRTRLSGHVEVLNYAKNGATLEALSHRLDELLTRSPRYVLVQFGHNDQKRYGLDVYEGLLRAYVERIEAAGAEAIVVSPVTRRNFDGAGRISPKRWNEPDKPFHATLGRYAQSAMAVASEMETLSIDLYTLSVDQANALGPRRCAAYNAQPRDTTHFSPAGADAVAAILVRELHEVAPGAFPPAR